MSSMQQPAEVVVNEQEYSKEIENAKTELTKLISGKKSLAPSMLRLAYAYQFTLASTAAKSDHDHDHAADKTKSTDETPSENKKENKQANNNDFRKAIDLCGQIKAFHPTITYADIYQLAGVVAVKALEGPDIKFRPGRKDTSITPDEGCLPDDQQGASDLRNKFYPMELGNKDIVALYGGLKLARAHSKRSGVEGWRTEEPLKFDNTYFVDLDRSTFVNLPPTERALVQDSAFHHFVKLYSEDKQAFFNDYAQAHKTLSEYKPASSFYESARRKITVEAKNTTVTQKAVGVAIAAAVAILGFFYLIKRRRARDYSSQQFHEPSVPVTFDELKKLETHLSNKKENEN